MNAEHLPGRDQGSDPTPTRERFGVPRREGDDAGSPSGGDGDFGFGAGLDDAPPSGGATKKAAAKKKRSTSASKAKKKPARKKAASSTATEDASEADVAAPAETATKKAKSPRRKRASSKTAAPAESAEEAEPSSEVTSPEAAPAAMAEAREADGEAADAAPAKKKRRRSRGKKKPAAAESPAEEESEAAPAALEADADEEDDAEGDAERGASEGEAGKKRRRRGRRGGRKRRRKGAEGGAAEGLPGEEDDLPEEEGPADDHAAEDGPKRKRKRSRRKKKPGAEAADEDEDEAEAPATATAKKSRRKRGGRGREPEVEKTPEDLAAEEEAARNQVILVNAVDREEKRVAVVQDGRIVEFLMTSESQKTLVNDIYRGKVVNLEPAIGAAFVDFGQGRNGFLHTSDVLAIYGEKDFTLDRLLTSKVDPEDWDESSSQPDVGEEVDDEEAAGKEAKGGHKGGRDRDRGRGRHRARERRPISDLIRVGDPVAIQVTKDAIGDKGPTLTTYLSIPGRYLVLMPSMSRTGVSRKIADDKERKRLKKILASLKGTEDMGVIVRTAGVGKTKTDLQRDLDYLQGVWLNLSKRLKHGRGPAPLYQESDVAVRTLRDLFDTRTKRVIVDDPMVHEQLLEFAEKLMPEHVDRIELHKADRPIFHHFGIEQDFEKIFTRRVELPSGGSIVFDQAEALVAIDVNSGRTRTDSFDFEEIALKTNLEAVPEIARQIRLRDLGGILVCDFIDMQRTSSNRTVERALRNALATDRARSKIGRISQFGLLEMTRQRLGPGTHKKVFQACPRCRGTGRIRTVASRAQAILRRLGSALTQKGFSSVELKAHPEVIEYLREDLYDYVRALEHRFEREVRLVAVPDQPEDSVLRYLRTDGVEVRPGGRRKR